MRYLLNIKSLILVLLVTLIAGCNSNGIKNRIVCTTMVASDMANQLLPPAVEIMGPGTDPHTYKSKSSDHQLLRNADVIVYSGLHLEGKLTEALENLSKKQKVICLSDGINKKELIATSEFGGQFDPHYWFDIDLYIKSTEYLAKELKQTFPQLSDSIDKNLENYKQILIASAKEFEKKTAELTLDQRHLVTAHDAFGYFGRRFGFKVKGVQGASTASEAGLRDIVNLTTHIINNDINAIFVESSVSEKNIQAIIEGCQNKGKKVIIGGKLYSDALGTRESEAGTYLGMMSYNINTIIKALK